MNPLHLILLYRKAGAYAEKRKSRNSKIEQIKLLINQTQKADMELELGVELPE